MSTTVPGGGRTRNAVQDFEFVGQGEAYAMPANATILSVYCTVTDGKGAAKKGL
jgi:hypothetical protein